MKRVFSFLLALLLVVGLVPVQAQADGEALLSVIWMTEDNDYIGDTYVTTQSTATVSIPVPDGYIITNAQPEADTPGLINSSNWTVTMPGASVMILVTVAPDGSSPAPSRKYNVSVSPYIENGTFTVNKNEADTDDTILITPEPDSGYKLSYVVVYNAEADGIEFDATPNGDGTYSFVVQNFDITIGGGFEPDSGTDPQPPQQPDPQPPQQTTKHTVTVIPEGSGTASANVSEAAYGDTVTITTVPGEGNWAQGIQGDQTNTHNLVEINRSNDNYDNFVFTMPEDDVEITVVFGPYPTITPVAGEGGKLEDVPGSAKPGTTVTFTPQPNAGYRVKEVIIGSDNNGTVTPAKKNDGSYEFTMPPSNVTITVIFEEAVTVTFNYNEGTNVDNVASVIIPAGNSLSALPNTSRADHKLVGWYLPNGTKVDAETSFADDTTITARWVYAKHTTKQQGNDFEADLAMENADVLDQLLDDEDLSTALKDGLNVYVFMEVAKKSEESVPSADKTAITSKVGSNKIAAYLDITLWKQIGEDRNAAKKITNTGDAVPITMKLDAGIIPANAGSVYIVYYHGEAKEIRNVSYNHATRELTFPASEFSTYSLVYTPYVAPAAAPASSNTYVLDNVPKTGEGSALMNWTLLVLCSAAMLATIAILDKKRAR